MGSLQVILFVWAEVLLIPILGTIWYGLRVENDRRERHLKAALKALGIIALTRGKK